MLETLPLRGEVANPHQAPAQVAEGTFYQLHGILSERQRALSLVLVLFVAWYGFCRQFRWFEAPVRLQYRFKVLVRSFLLDTLHLTKVKRNPLSNDEWESQPGWPMMLTLLLTIIALAVFAMLITQRYKQGLEIAGVTLTFIGLARIFGGTSKSWVMMLQRVLVVHQYTFYFVAYGSMPDNLLIRRGIITRSLTCMCFFDSLDEVFVQSFAFTLLLSIRENDISAWLPMQAFFMLVLPAEILGVRDAFLLRDSSVRSILSSPSWRMLIIFSPLASTIVFSFNSGQQAGVVVSRMVAGLNLALFLACVIATDKVDDVIMPSVRSNSKEFGEQKNSSVDSGRLRGLSIMFHALTVLTIALTPDNTVVILLFSLTRLALFSINQQRFSQQCMDSCLFRVLAALLASASMQSLILFLTILEFVIGLLLSIAQERSAYLMRQEAESRAFIDHAYKQKLSAVSHALEQTLNSKVELNENMRGLLLTCLKESHKGHDRCHISNVGRALAAGRYKPVPTESTLKNAVKVWQASKWMDNEITCIPDQSRTYCFIMIRLDWDLLKLVVADWTRYFGPLSISSQWESNDDQGYHRRICITVRSETPRLYRHLFETANLEGHKLIIDALGSGKFLKNNSGFKVYGIASETSVREQPSVIPAGLIYAVLDDNNLVRKNVMRALKAEPLFCNDQSFACGDTHTECEAFAQSIVDRKVDVAVFDQNLDICDSKGQEYNIKGSDIARRARELGYRGVAVLHTADQYSSVVDERGLFDGYISKAASTHAFLEGLTRAWEKHLRLSNKKDSS